MPRAPRQSVGGLIYHVYNEARGRRKLFESDADYAAFTAVLEEGQERYPQVQLLAFCLVPSRFHVVIKPKSDGELSQFMRWVTQTHGHRWRNIGRRVGRGGMYQGRFRSFVVQENQHVLVLCRYIEQLPVREAFSKTAQAWPWSSAGVRAGAGPAKAARPHLDSWPVRRPGNWLKLINDSMPKPDVERVETSIIRSRPLGDPPWQQRIARKLHLEHTLRPIGRPRGAPDVQPRKKRAKGKPRTASRR